jgi:hypothetical protein
MSGQKKTSNRQEDSKEEEEQTVHQSGWMSIALILQLRITDRTHAFS